MSWVSKLEDAGVATRTRQGFVYLATHHLAYRGTPPVPAIKVLSTPSRTSLVLGSCLVPGTAPWAQYNVTTGKRVKAAEVRNPPPPYLLTVFMRLRATGWRISSIAQDTSKTCRG